MNKSAIKHIAGGNYAFPLNETTLMIRLKAAKGDLKAITVVYGSRYPQADEEPNKLKKLELIARDEEHDYFSTTINLDSPYFRYHFFLDDGEERYWYNEKGFFKKRPVRIKTGFFQFPFINPNDIFQTPKWVHNAVFYQIFPERFFNGNPDNDPKDVQTWGERPKRDSFFGGDLEGIIKKLDYIEELGVNAIYLTPIFKSSSNHKYNIEDYYKIDSHFGDLEIARKLIKEAHYRGIKVILDAVFNHCAYNFFAFKDVREKGSNSHYVDWFDIEDFPIRTTPQINYKTFANKVASMPKLMTHNPEVRDYLLHVAKYWIKEVNADGWRLDVADEVNHQFWREFRKLIKEVKPDAYIVGEIWHDAQAWLEGDQFDGVMNYIFTEAVIDFFSGNIGPNIFDARLSKNRMIYQDTVNYAMLNLLDSHDTPRILHYLAGNKEKLKLAVLFQMTYLGVPMVYYGDEIGLTGDDDPDCRRCMVWDEDGQDLELLYYYKKLISLRKSLAPLCRGNFRTLLIDEENNIYGFKRTLGEESVFIFLNNSPFKHKIELNAEKIKRDRLKDYLTNLVYFKQDGKFLIEISPYQGVILK